MALDRAYIFRDREILVEGGGDAAKAERIASFVSADIRARFNDRVSGGTALILQPGTPAPEGCSFEHLPSYFFTHDEAEIALTSRLKALGSWVDGTRFCPSCGQPLRLHAVETALECPACGRLLFPRIEPCIITLITRGDELLLLRNVKDTRGVYACLAGFVEAGETLEQALRREVREETSLEVENIRYAGSQAWPFPDQLMMAFYADYKSGEIKIQESEIRDARWFRPDALPPLPRPGSIARRLIERRIRELKGE